MEARAAGRDIFHVGGLDSRPVDLHVVDDVGQLRRDGAALGGASWLHGMEGNWLTSTNSPSATIKSALICWFAASPVEMPRLVKPTIFLDLAVRDTTQLGEIERTPQPAALVVDGHLLFEQLFDPLVGIVLYV